MPLCPDRLHPLVSRFDNTNTFIHCFNSIEPILCFWYGQLKPTIKITVAILFKHKTLNQCCFNVGLASADSNTTLSQQRDKSMCVLGTLNAIPFDKQIYIYLQVQKLNGDF